MIRCSDHDYIEIACLYRYPVTITLASGAVVQGIALDTARNEFREECILLKADGVDRLVPLDTISSLECCIENPHFHKIVFT